MTRTNRKLGSAWLLEAAACFFLWSDKLSGEVWAWFSWALWAACFAAWTIDKLVLFRWGPASPTGKAGKD